MKLKLRARRRRAGVLAAAAVVTAAVLGAVGGGGPVGATTLPGGTWGQPQAIAGLAALPDGLSASDASAIGCSSLGNCSAVGYYETVAGPGDPFAVTETDGVWGSAQSLVGAPGAPSSVGALDEVSCGAPGYCTASGSYGGQHGYLATEVKGAWSVRTLPGTIGSDTVTASGIDSVACTSAGDCTVVGWYGTTSNGSSVRHAFTLDESGGTWGTPQPVAGLPPGGGTPGQTSSLLESVSCFGPGGCTAGGAYDTGSGYAPFLVSESGGTWGSPQEVPGFAALNSGGALSSVSSVSCPDASDCAMAGIYGSLVFTADEVGGTWKPAKPLNLPSQANANTSVITVGCRAAGNCVVAGRSQDMSMFAAAETSGGGWGQGQVLSGGLFRGLSCAPGGDCTLAGYSVLSESLFRVFATTIGTDGTIGTPQPVQPAANTIVLGLDCPQDGYCTMAEGVGNATASQSLAQLLTEANPASVTLTASAPQVSYGSEPAETFTAAVSSSAGGTPTGTVTVTGPSGAACTITLAGGTGNCSFSPAQFPVGGYTVTGAYSGAPYYLTAGATASVTVAKGKTATRLAPSTVVITPGQGATETLTVTVSHAGSVAPTGYVPVKDGASVACTVILAGGTGSCAVSADQLVKYGRVLTAAYPGDGNFLASASPPVYLMIAPARPRLAWPLHGRPASPVSRLHGRPAPPAE